MVSKNICLNRGEKKRKTQRFSGAKKGHVMEEDQNFCQYCFTKLFGRRKNQMKK